MKKLLVILIGFSFFATSCSKYSRLTYDKYKILYRDNNLSKVKCKTVEPIQLRLQITDTIVSSVNQSGTAEFKNITRSITPLEPSHLKIVEFDTHTFTIEFVNYNLKLTFIKQKDGNFVVLRDKDGLLKGTNFILDNDNINLFFKNTKKSVNQEINLEK